MIDDLIGAVFEVVSDSIGDGIDFFSGGSSTTYSNYQLNNTLIQKFGDFIDLSYVVNETSRMAIQESLEYALESSDAPMIRIMKKDGQHILMFRTKHDFANGTGNVGCGKRTYQIIGSSEKIIPELIKEDGSYYLQFKGEHLLDGVDGAYNSKDYKYRFKIIDR